MPEPRCDKCKEWQESTRGSDGISLGYGTCAAAAGNDGKAMRSDTLHWADDAESYGAELNTKPSFGCVSFKSRKKRSS